MAEMARHTRPLSAEKELERKVNDNQDWSEQCNPQPATSTRRIGNGKHATYAYPKSSILAGGPDGRHETLCRKGMAACRQHLEQFSVNLGDASLDRLN
jgi:hypothetical protein